MKMKSQRKTERDRSKREAARTRPATDPDAVDSLLDDLDDQVARSVMGYDE